jgi:GT2 family glycosyltransferase
MISVFATSIRPHYWKKFYYDIQEATTHPFEIVFTSPKPRIEGLPSNFRVIQTDVKPAQAMEAAFRACRYPFVVQAVDDIKFDPGALDRLMAVLKDQPNTIASCKYGVGATGDGTCAQTEGIFGLCGEWPEKRAANIPLQPVCPMLRSYDWIMAQGLDPRFGASYGDLDLYLRLIASGYKVVMTDDWVREYDGGSDLWRTKGQNDLRTIRSLWRDPVTGDFSPNQRRGVWALRWLDDFHCESGRCVVE